MATYVTLRWRWWVEVVKSFILFALPQRVSSHSNCAKKAPENANLWSMCTAIIKVKVGKNMWKCSRYDHEDYHKKKLLSTLFAALNILHFTHAAAEGVVGTGFTKKCWMKMRNNFQSTYEPSENSSRIVKWLHNESVLFPRIRKHKTTKRATRSDLSTGISIVQIITLTIVVVYACCKELPLEDHKQCRSLFRGAN